MQPLAIGVAQIQRQALQGCGFHADGAQQLQAGLVGTDQDVLAVVDRPVATVGCGNVQGARTAAPLAAGFPDLHLVALLLQGDGGGHAGPAAAHDGDALRLGHGPYMRPRACIFHASHSLRSGVRAMRWCSTWNWPASISRSSVR